MGTLRGQGWAAHMPFRRQAVEAAAAGDQAVRLASRMVSAVAGPRELVGLCGLLLLLHLVTLRWASYATVSDAESTRLLSATLQDGALYLFSAVLSLGSVRWQIEEGYASFPLTFIGPRVFLLGNYLAVLAALVPPLVTHVLIVFVDYLWRGGHSPLHPTIWAVYTVNVSLGCAAVAALGTAWGLWLPRSFGTVYLLAVLTLWLGFIPEPLSFALPPLSLLEATGLLTSAGNSSSYSVQPGPWVLSCLGTAIYCAAALSCIPWASLRGRLKT